MEGKLFEFPKKGNALKLVSEKEQFYALIVKIDGDYSLINAENWKAVRYVPYKDAPDIYRFSTISGLLSDMMKKYKVYVLGPMYFYTDEDKN